MFNVSPFCTTPFNTTPANVTLREGVSVVAPITAKGTRTPWYGGDTYLRQVMELASLSAVRSVDNHAAPFFDSVDLQFTGYTTHIHSVFFPIAYAATDVTVYQQDVVIHRSEGTSYEETVGDLKVWHVYVGDRCKSDYGDIRFTDASGNALAYYLWPDHDAESARFTVRLEGATSAGELLVWYGNPTATTTSDGDAVYFFFDQFDGAALDTTKWDQSPKSTVTVSGGTVSVKGIWDGGTFHGIKGKQSFDTQACRLEIQCLAIPDRFGEIGWGDHQSFTPDMNRITIRVANPGERVGVVKKGETGSHYFTWGWPVPPKQYGFARSGASALYYIDGVLSKTYTSSTHVPTVPLSPVINTNGEGGPFIVDSVVVRAHSATPPAATAFGPEQAYVPGLSYMAPFSVRRTCVFVGNASETAHIHPVFDEADLQFTGYGSGVSIIAPIFDDNDLQLLGHVSGLSYMAPFSARRACSFIGNVSKTTHIRSVFNEVGLQFSGYGSEVSTVAPIFNDDDLQFLGHVSRLSYMAPFLVRRACVFVGNASETTHIHPVFGEADLQFTGYVFPVSQTSPIFDEVSLRFTGYVSPVAHAARMITLHQTAVSSFVDRIVHVGIVTAMPQVIARYTNDMTVVSGAIITPKPIVRGIWFTTSTNVLDNITTAHAVTVRYVNDMSVWCEKVASDFAISGNWFCDPVSALPRVTTDYSARFTGFINTITFVEPITHDVAISVYQALDDLTKAIIELPKTGYFVRLDRTYANVLIGRKPR